MKKKKVFMLAALLVGMLFLAGCNSGGGGSVDFGSNNNAGNANNNTSTADNNPTPSPTPEPPAEVVANPLVSTWFVNMDYDLGFGDGTHNYDYYLIFNEDNSGSFRFIWTGNRAWQLSSDFTWRSDNNGNLESTTISISITGVDGVTVSIPVPAEYATETMRYNISGNRLTYTDEDGNTYTLERR